MLALVAFLAALTTPAPVPAATPSPAPVLKTIVHVRSSPFCSALRDKLGPAIAGLLANDTLANTSKPMLVKMSRDYYSGSAIDPSHRSPSMQMDVMRMNQLVWSIVQNRDKVDTLLRDPALWRNVTSDDARLAQMRSQLQDVEDKQNRTLNVLSGFTDTYALEDLLGRGNGLNGALGKEAGGAESESFFGCGPVDKSPACKNDPALNLPTDMMANSPITEFYVAVMRTQQATARAESTAAQTVTAAANACR